MCAPNHSQVCQFHDTEYNTFSGSDDEQDTVATAKHTTLPATALFNSWDHLILEDGLKERLMSYAITAMELVRIVPSSCPAPAP